MHLFTERGGDFYLKQRMPEDHEWQQASVPSRDRFSDILETKGGKHTVRMCQECSLVNTFGVQNNFVWPLSWPFGPLHRKGIQEVSMKAQVLVNNFWQPKLQILQPSFPQCVCEREWKWERSNTIGTITRRKRRECLDGMIDEKKEEKWISERKIELKKIMKKGSIKLTKRENVQFAKFLVVSILLYGCETWILFAD